MKLKVLSSALLLSTLMLSLSNAFACTGIQLKAKDGAAVNGRTVEFGTPIDFTGTVIPRNYSFTGTLPDGNPGLHYRAKYATVGATTFGMPAVMDGMNEKGLSVGAFYFPGYASYTPITAENKDHAVSPTEFPNWLLTQFATVDEVKAGLKSVVIAPSTPKGWGNTPPPFHYVVYDKTGKSLVIEPINGQLKVYDNPIGVITNSPTFDWQLTNLAQYINLSPNNAAPKTIDGVKLQVYGQGSGLHGLPGDFTPPSRFVRAAVFASTALPVDNSQDVVYQVFHILNQFDIPMGSSRAIGPDGKIYPDYTMATTVKDPSTLRYYFKTYQDQNIEFIDLNKFDLNATTLKSVTMMGTQTATDVSAQAK